MRQRATKKNSVVLSANTRGARAAVITDPLHMRALLREPVAIGLAVHPAVPLLAQLAVRDPPFARVRRAVAAGETRGHGAHLAGHAAVGGVADRQLEAR